MFELSGPWSDTLLSVALVSVLPLAVTFAMARSEWAMRRHLPQLTAFGAGAVLGAAVAHIIPEALSDGRPPAMVALAVVAGFIAFWLVERVLAQHDHAHAHGVALGAPSAHESDSSEAECRHLQPGSASSLSRSLVPMTFAGDAIHNVVDGMLIAAGFLAEPRVGLLTLMAVALHELPREIGTFSLFVHGGINPMRAVAYNLLTAILAMLGAAATLLVGTQVTAVAAWLLPVAAGTYVYIALAVGRASLHDKHSDPTRWGRLGWGAAGVVLMTATAMLPR